MRGGKTLEIMLERNPAVLVLRTIPSVFDLLDARAHAAGAQLDQVRSQPGDDSSQNHGCEDARPGGNPQAQAHRERDDARRQQERKIPVTRKKPRQLRPPLGKTGSYRLQHWLVPNHETRHHQNHGRDGEQNRPQHPTGFLHRRKSRRTLPELTAKTLQPIAAPSPPATRLPCAAAPRTRHRKQSGLEPPHPAILQARPDARFAGPRCD